MIKYFYCEECGNIHAAKFEFDAKYTDDNLEYHVNCYYKCKDCDNTAVEIDSGMIRIIQRLNTTKLKTAYCCEGHIVTYDGVTGISRPYIVFKPTVTMELFNEIIGKCALPEKWGIDFDNEGNMIRIQYDMEETRIDTLINDSSLFEAEKKCYLIDLETWVDKTMVLCEDIYDRV